MSDDKKTEVNENEQDFTMHRQLISHAMKGEPAQMGPIFGKLMASKISSAIETRRAEVGANLFAGAATDDE